MDRGRGGQRVHAARVPKFCPKRRRRLKSRYYFSCPQCLQHAPHWPGPSVRRSDTREFCHAVGLNYVSCSPFRVPIARLAAAHAAIKGEGNARSNGAVKKAKKK